MHDRRGTIRVRSMAVKIIQTRISERGEIVLPPEVLQLLGVGPRDRVEITIEDDGVRIVAPSQDEHLQPRSIEDRGHRAARRRAALTGISAVIAPASVENAAQSRPTATAEFPAK